MHQPRLPRSSRPVGDRADRGDAVVLGAGMAGLLAARVLGDHFARVTVVERDRVPSRPAFRAGVPQSRHLHSLLVRGRLILDHLFPGLGDELAAAGAADLEWGPTSSGSARSAPASASGPG